MGSDILTKKNTQIVKKVLANLEFFYIEYLTYFLNFLELLEVLEPF